MDSSRSGHNQLFGIVLLAFVILCSAATATAESAPAVRYSERGLELESSFGEQEWSWRLWLNQIGRGKKLAAPQPPQVVRGESRTEYRYAGVTEWYLENEEDIEHGFTIPERIPGSTGLLTLELNVESKLKLGHQGQGIVFRTTSSIPAVYYHSLHVKDHSGSLLDSRLQSHPTASGYRLTISIDDSKATYPIEVDPLVTTFTTELEAHPSATWYGMSLAIEGDTAVVASWSNNDPNITSGIVHVYHRNHNGADQWGLVATITEPIASFGRSLALSHDTLVVGAPNAEVNGAYTGAAYIYGRDVGGPNGWGRLAELVPSSGEAGCDFGMAVDIEGDLVVVGAPEHLRPEMGGRTGGVFVLSRNQGGPEQWGEISQIFPLDSGQTFGAQVQLDGSLLAIGASDSHAVYLARQNHGGPDAWSIFRKLGAGPSTCLNESFAQMVLSGDALISSCELWSSSRVFAILRSRDQDGADQWGVSAEIAAPLNQDSDIFRGISLVGDTLSVAHADNGLYIFDRNHGGPDAWGLASIVPAPEPDLGFGVELSSDGRSLLVGALDFSHNLFGNAYIYTFSGDTWELEAEIDQSLGSSSPTSIAVDGDYAVIGDPDANGTGTAMIYRRNTGGNTQWHLVDTLEGQDQGAGFGESVDLDSDIIAIGAPHEADAGTAFLFERSSFAADTWTEIRRLSPEGLANGVRFGHSLSIDGQFLVVGAPGQEPNGQAPGAALVFQKNLGGADGWELNQVLTNPNASAGDLFGAATAIENDTIVIGAPASDLLGPDSGAAELYSRNDSETVTWTHARTLLADDGSAHDHFGADLDLVEMTLIIGAPDSGSPDSQPGSSYIFRRHEDGPDQWQQVAGLDGGDLGGRFGQKVATVGGLAVVAAPTTGTLHLFEDTADGQSDWRWHSSITAPEGHSNSGFGSSLALDKYLVMAGTSATGTEKKSWGFRLTSQEADLGVTLDNEHNMIFPNSQVQWQLVATNSGPSTIDGASVDLTFEPSYFVASGSFTCAPAPGSSAGASCPASGTLEELAGGIEVSFHSGDQLVFNVDITMGPGYGDELNAHASVSCPPPFLDNLLDNNQTTDTDHVALGADFGDAPDPGYPTYGHTDGAVHYDDATTGDPYFGQGVDFEQDGKASANADGDWDDGITFPDPMLAGEISTLEVVVGGWNSRFRIWIDWNQDGDWQDPSESVLYETLNSGTYQRPILIPPTAQNGLTFARARISRHSIAEPTGPIYTGEVEDYQVHILHPTVFNDGFASGDTTAWSTVQDGVDP